VAAAAMMVFIISRMSCSIVTTNYDNKALYLIGQLSTTHRIIISNPFSYDKVLLSQHSNQPYCLVQTNQLLI
jgi:hypothetical protein